MSTSRAEDERKVEALIREAQFTTAFKELQADAAAINKKNRFSTDDPLIDEFEQWFLHINPFEDIGGAVRTKFLPLFASFRNARIGLKLMLTVGEIGETLEAVRTDMGPDSHIPTFSSEEAEVADAVIRLMNYATDRKLRLAEAIFAKNEYNRNRVDHSKDARAGVHGKKF